MLFQVTEATPKDQVWTESRGSFKNWLKHFIKDARHFQIIYLSLFLVYGFLELGWGADWEKYLMILKEDKKRYLKFTTAIIVLTSTK